MKVQDLFADKNRPVHSIDGNRSVDDAITLMADEKASALVVTKNDQPVGIFAERDVFRYYLRNKSTALSEITLRNAMTDRLIAARPDDDVSRVIAIMVKADVPGAKKEDIEIDLREGVLTITAQVEDSTSEWRALYREHGVGGFTRRFSLGDRIDQGKITAQVDHGVLHLTLPKAEAHKPRRIEIG